MTLTDILSTALKHSSTQQRHKTVVVILDILLEHMSPGELRAALRDAERGVEVLNYEHPLLDDPVVSCASKKQLIDQLWQRFCFAAINSRNF